MSLDNPRDLSKTTRDSLEERKENSARAEKKYGLQAFPLDEHTIRVRNRDGVEVTFSYAMDEIPLDTYDAFVSQMGSKTDPLPAYPKWKIAHFHPQAKYVAGEPIRQSVNIESAPVEDFERVACSYGIRGGEREFVCMAIFAGYQLYELYRKRLRGSEK